MWKKSQSSEGTPRLFPERPARLVALPSPRRDQDTTNEREPGRAHRPYAHLACGNTPAGRSASYFADALWIVSLVGGPIAPSFSPELASILVELDGLVEAPGDFGRYLNQVQPLGRDLAASREDGVRFMTMASSKGLTVQATIIIAAEEGVIPRPEADLAEERRLLYVALTRARRFVYATWSRRRFGPTARSGRPNVAQRRSPSSYFANGPVQSIDGRQYISNRWPDH